MSDGGGGPLPTAQASILTKNIADSEVLNEVSQIVLKIDYVFVIGTTLFQFSLKITPDSRFVLLGLISGVLSLLSML